MAQIVMLRRLGIIGDVHTEAETLLRAIEHLRGIDAEQLVCTGDIVDGHGDGYDVDECSLMLKEFRVLTICGNHDRWILESSMRNLPGATEHAELEPATITYLQGLPTTAELDTRLGQLLLCHGLDDDDMASVAPDDHGYALRHNEPLQRLLNRRRHSVVVAGHTHRRMVRRIDDLLVINAGTLHRDNRPCFGLLDLEAECVDFFATTGETTDHIPLNLRPARATT